jgi:hypothetical protein
MNYLKGKTVYLSGAMAALADGGVKWREYVSTKMEDLGVEILDPTKKKSHSLEEIGENKNEFRELILQERFYELAEKFYPVARWDLRSVDKADFLIVDYDPSIHTVGTIDEIVIAHIEKKPILLKYEKSQLNLFNPWITVRVKPEHLFATWDDLFKHLDDVNKGNFNHGLWTL